MGGAVLACALWSACGRGGTVEERDVRGNYALTYDDRLTLKLDVGGAVREVTAQGPGAIADFGVINGQHVTLNLAEFCARPEVKCPSEQFWPRISVDQPDLLKNPSNLQPLHVIDDTTHALPTGQKATSIGGLVNHGNVDRFVVGLGLEGASNPACAAFAVSFAVGRFTRQGETVSTVYRYRQPNGLECEPPSLACGSMLRDGGMGRDGGIANGGHSDAGCADGGIDAQDGGVDGGVACQLVPVNEIVQTPAAPIDGIREGRVGLAWAGGCAFGPFLAGATLYLETGYSGKRTGAFDPPPYTPAAVVLPDGSFPDAGSVDGG